MSTLDFSVRRACPEVRLWRAVILQVIQDFASQSRNKDAQTAKLHARNWIFGCSHDLHTVCDMADIHPHVLKTVANRIATSGLSWRAPAGKGKRYLERKLYRDRQQTLQAISSSSEVFLS